MMKKLFFLVLLSTAFSYLHGQCLPIQDNVLFLDNWDNDSLYPTNRQNRHFSDIWGYASGNDEYAIIGGQDSIFIINVTDPEDIFRSTAIYQGDTSLWRDFKTFGNYLYSIVDEGFSADKGLVIYDLSNLPTVTKVREINSEFGNCHNIFIDVDEARLYAGGFAISNDTPSADDICIYDLSVDASNPTLLACINLDAIEQGGASNFYFHDIFVRDNIVYGSHGYTGYYIWDMNDVNNISVLGSLDNTFFDVGYVHSSWNTDDNNHAIVATEVGTDPKVYWIDQTSPNNISVESSFKDPLCDDPNNLDRQLPHNPFILGSKIYLSNYQDGVQVLEFDDMTSSLVRLGYYDTYPSYAVTCYGDSTCKGRLRNHVPLPIGGSIPVCSGSFEDIFIKYFILKGK